MRLVISMEQHVILICADNFFYRCAKACCVLKNEKNTYFERKNTKGEYWNKEKMPKYGTQSNECLGVCLK